MKAMKRLVSILSLAAIVLGMCFTGGRTYADCYISASGSKEEFPIYATVAAEMLEIRSDIWQRGSRVSFCLQGDELEIWETKEGWGRTEKGWVNIRYATVHGPIAKSEQADAAEPVASDEPEHLPIVARDVGYTKMGIVLGSKQFATEKEDPASDVTGYYCGGDRIGILEVIGTRCHTSYGWLDRDAVYVEGGSGKEVKGTVNKEMLMVWAGPGFQYEGLKRLSRGTKVTIKQVLDIDGQEWGYTNGGWVDMEFVKTK